MRTLTRILAVAGTFLGILLSGSAFAQVLYAADGGGGNPACRLYTLNPATGAIAESDRPAATMYHKSHRPAKKPAVRFVAANRLAWPWSPCGAGAARLFKVLEHWNSYLVRNEPRNAYPPWRAHRSALPLAPWHRRRSQDPRNDA